jgi:hypothetical protein
MIPVSLVNPIHSATPESIADDPYDVSIESASRDSRHCIKGAHVNFSRRTARTSPLAGNLPQYRAAVFSALHFGVSILHIYHE